MSLGNGDDEDLMAEEESVDVLCHGFVSDMWGNEMAATSAVHHQHHLDNNSSNHMDESTLMPPPAPRAPFHC
jgi:hypothetical protein